MTRLAEKPVLCIVAYTVVQPRLPKVAALKAHLFNHVSWPDFSVLPHAKATVLQFYPVA